jgi:hypothetical protein
MGYNSFFSLTFSFLFRMMGAERPEVVEMVFLGRSIVMVDVWIADIPIRRCNNCHQQPRHCWATTIGEDVYGGEVRV